MIIRVPRNKVSNRRIQDYDSFIIIEGSDDENPVYENEGRELSEEPSDKEEREKKKRMKKRKKEIFLLRIRFSR
jgi:hypothetical protein